MRTGILLLVFVLTASACSSFGERVCTLIGCDDGLGISLSEPPVGPFTIEVEEPDGTVHQRTCPAGTVCDGEFFFAGIQASEVFIRVVLDDRTVELWVAPRYERFQPNGRDCPPVCHVARVRVEI